jgi:hypothetical protein
MYVGGAQLPVSLTATCTIIRVPRSLDVMKPTCFSSCAAVISIEACTVCTPVFRNCTHYAVRIYFYQGLQTSFYKGIQPVCASHFSLTSHLGKFKRVMSSTLTREFSQTFCYKAVREINNSPTIISEIFSLRNQTPSYAVCNPLWDFRFYT